MKSISEQKAQLRSQFQRTRDALDAATYRETSHAITEQVKELPPVKQARTLLAYWPREGRREIDTRALIRWLLERGTRVALPVVDSFTRPNGEPGVPEMHAVHFENEEQLRANRWGVYEPAGSSTVPASELDAIIVPAFGAGRNGHRIGHGKGYYDVFLSRCRATTICLVYDVCLVPRVPAEPHDVPVDIIVTEREALYPEKDRTMADTSPSSPGSS